ncbi:hypothetical protein BC351_10600 [Paenibacillus ferrarius]|uniref:Uncharacterized protein n=1 Tax=Paenibacillus ferrarius TaxID=1469647 RepID=A0A1V4H8U4_9BACL|nr:hypothetical protein [Paenibacillus ferrarius]OPH47630.1 hypothetical protein BC351_10600 [Paenibacillus ferrarius]
MALQKPYNISFKGLTIAAGEVNKLTWQVSGDLSVAYQVRVFKNSDNILIYNSSKITSFANSHSIPANSFLNGLEYKIQVIIWNDAGAGIFSDYEIFQTSSRPVVGVSPIGTVGSQTYNFTATYSQLESVSMRSWIFYLYDANKLKIFQSEIQTNTNIHYLISGLKSNTNYYVEFQTTSNKGLVGTSGLVSFSVSYSQPNINTNLTAENNENAGIKLTWNTIQIIGSTLSAPIFINGEKLNVRNDVFSFSEGFQLTNNFTLKLWFENITSNVDLLVIKGQSGTISLQYWNDHKFHLFKDVYGYRSHNVSSELIGSGFFVYIQQIDGDMNIEGEVVK